MTKRQLAIEFVTRFCAGNIDGLAPLLADDLHVVGPYLEVRSRATYLDSLEKDPPQPSRVRLLSVTDNGDTVAIFYEYDKGNDTLTIAQLFTIRSQKIEEILLVFDGRKVT